MITLKEAKHVVVPTPVTVTLEFSTPEELEDVMKKVGQTTSVREPATSHECKGQNWYNFYVALQDAAKKIAQEARR